MMPFWKLAELAAAPYFHSIPVGVYVCSSHLYTRAVGKRSFSAARVWKIVVWMGDGGFHTDCRTEAHEYTAVRLERVVFVEDTWIWKGMTHRNTLTAMQTRTEYAPHRRRRSDVNSFSKIFVTRSPSSKCFILVFSTRIRLANAECECEYEVAIVLHAYTTHRIAYKCEANVIQSDLFVYEHLYVRSRRPMLGHAARLVLMAKSKRHSFHRQSIHRPLIQGHRRYVYVP